MQSRIFMRSRIVGKVFHQSWTARNINNFTFPALFTTSKHYLHDNKFIDTSEHIDTPSRSLDNQISMENSDKVESFFGDLPVKEAPKKEMKNPNRDPLRELIDYLHSGQSLSNKLTRLKYFSINTKRKMQTSSVSGQVVETSNQQPLVPLSLLRNMIFECTTLQEILSIGRSIRPHMVPRSEGRHELCCLMLQQCCLIYQNDNNMFAAENLTPEIVSDYFDLLNLSRYQGVKTSSLSPEMKRFVWETIKCLHSFPLEFSKSSNMLQNMVAFFDCGPSKSETVKMIETSFIRNYKLATADNHLNSNQVALALYGIRILQESLSFQFSSEMDAIIRSLAESAADLVNAVGETTSMNLNLQTNTLTANFAQILFNLSLLKFPPSEDTIDLRDKMLLATQKLAPFFNDSNLTLVMASLGDLSFTFKDLQRLSPKLIQTCEDRLESMPSENFSFLLKGLSNLQFSFGSNGEEEIKKLGSKLLIKYENCLTSPDMMKEQAFIRCIHVLRKMNMPWETLPQPIKKSFAHCVVKLLPEVSWGNMGQLFISMAYWNVHYPFIASFNFEQQFLALKTQDPQKFAKWSTLEISSLLNSLAKMNGHWPSFSPEMQNFFNEQMISVCQNVSLPYPNRLAFFGECIHSLGYMRANWTNLHPQVQIHLISLMENMDSDTLKEEITVDNIVQMRKDVFSLVRGCGLASFPFSPFVDCLWPLVSTVINHPVNDRIEALLKINLSVQMVCLWHGLGNLDGASWDGLSESMIATLLQQAKKAMPVVNNKALSIMCFWTVKLAFDSSPFSSKNKSSVNGIDRRQELLDLTHLLLKEMISRLQSVDNKIPVADYVMFLLFAQRLAQQSSLNHPLKQLWEQNRVLLISALAKDSGTNKITVHDTMEFEQFDTISSFHAKVSAQLKNILIDNQSPLKDVKYKIVDEFEGLKCESVPLPGYPMDIAIFASNNDRKDEPILFVEIDGNQHYITTMAQNTGIFNNSVFDDVDDEDDDDNEEEETGKRKEGHDLKLRRIDAMKEHFYRELYPTVPILRCLINGNFESYVVKKKILPMVWEQTDLFRGGTSRRKYVRKANNSSKETVNFKTDETSLLLDCDGDDVRKPVLKKGSKSILKQQDRHEEDNFEEEDEDEEKSINERKVSVSKEKKTVEKTPISVRGRKREVKEKDENGVDSGNDETDEYYDKEDNMNDEEVFTTMVLEEAEKKKSKMGKIVSSKSSSEAKNGAFSITEPKKRGRKSKAATATDEEDGTSSAPKTGKTKTAKDGGQLKYKLNI